MRLLPFIGAVLIGAGSGYYIFNDGLRQVSNELKREREATLQSSTQTPTSTTTSTSSQTTTKSTTDK
ncbi:hypothetical protein SAMD00019534_051200, partial [Acytostelium subglobosum LB1]|uniref:hypothetical protein n=1 Tax=Acytostelium subglobosum LB1 TaxID=1410327 RepID=UPI00064511C3